MILSECVICTGKAAQNENERTPRIEEREDLAKQVKEAVAAGDKTVKAPPAAAAAGELLSSCSDIIMMFVIVARH